MEIARGIGTLALLLGGAGVLTRFSRSFKFYPGPYPRTQSMLRWSGRVGVVLLAVGALLVVMSTF